jgi:hypothetical protein
VRGPFVAGFAHVSSGHAYVDAMRWTMLLPIAIVTLAAVTALAIRQAPANDSHTGERAAPEPPTGAAP